MRSYPLQGNPTRYEIQGKASLKSNLSWVEPSSFCNQNGVASYFSLWWQAHTLVLPQKWTEYSPSPYMSEFLSVFVPCLCCPQWKQTDPHSVPRVGEWMELWLPLHSQSPTTHDTHWRRARFGLVAVSYTSNGKHSPLAWVWCWVSPTRWTPSLWYGVRLGCWRWWTPPGGCYVAGWHDTRTASSQKCSPLTVGSWTWAAKQMMGSAMGALMLPGVRRSLQVHLLEACRQQVWVPAVKQAPVPSKVS